jgi:hypothetical protein
MKEKNRNHEIYLETFAILEKMKIELDEKTCNQAFKFYWNGKQFRRDTFERALAQWKSSKGAEEDLNVSDEDIKRMKIALSDSYRTISKAAELSRLNRSMVKRLVENGTISSVRVNNPYYSKSPPMTLIRMSELEQWMDKNDRAVSASRKSLEVIEKAKKTRQENIRKRNEVFEKAIEKAVSEFGAIAKEDPVPLLFLLLKQLQILIGDKHELRELYVDKLIRIIRIADPRNLSFNHVMDVEEIYSATLCETCTMSAISMGISANEYKRRFGTCSKCITRKEVLETGRHYEVVFTRNDFSLIFRVSRSLLKKIEDNFPEGFIAFNRKISDKSGNFWDTIPKWAIHSSVYEILENMGSTLKLVEK